MESCLFLGFFNAKIKKKRYLATVIIAQKTIFTAISPNDTKCNPVKFEIHGTFLLIVMKNDLKKFEILNFTRF